MIAAAAPLLLLGAVILGLLATSKGGGESLRDRIRKAACSLDPTFIEGVAAEAARENLGEAATLLRERARRLRKAPGAPLSREDAATILRAAAQIEDPRDLLEDAERLERGGYPSQAAALRGRAASPLTAAGEATIRRQLTQMRRPPNEIDEFVKAIKAERARLASDPTLLCSLLDRQEVVTVLRPDSPPVSIPVTQQPRPEGGGAGTPPTPPPSKVPPKAPPAQPVAVPITQPDGSPGTMVIAKPPAPGDTERLRADAERREAQDQLAHARKLAAAQRDAEQKAAQAKQRGDVAEAQAQAAHSRVLADLQRKTEREAAESKRKAEEDTKKAERAEAAEATRIKKLKADAIARADAEADAIHKAARKAGTPAALREAATNLRQRNAERYAGRINDLVARALQVEIAERKREATAQVGRETDPARLEELAQEAGRAGWPDLAKAIRDRRDRIVKGRADEAAAATKRAADEQAKAIWEGLRKSTDIVQVRRGIDDLKARGYGAWAEDLTKRAKVLEAEEHKRQAAASSSPVTLPSAPSEAEWTAAPQGPAAVTIAVTKPDGSVAPLTISPAPAEAKASAAKSKAKAKVPPPSQYGFKDTPKAIRWVQDQLRWASKMSGDKALDPRGVDGIWGANTWKAVDHLLATYGEDFDAAIIKAKAKAPTVTVSGGGVFYASPFPGVSDDAWAYFVERMAVGDTKTISPQFKLGRFGYSMRRLCDLGLCCNPRQTKYQGRTVWVAEWMPGLSQSVFLSSPDLQYQTFLQDMTDGAAYLLASYYAPAGGADVIGAPGHDGKPVTLSGLLAVAKLASPTGLAQWLIDAVDEDGVHERKKFPATTDAYLRTNGIF